MDNAPALTTACPTREPLAHEAPQDQQPIALHENEAMTQDLYKRHRCYKIEVLSAPIPTPPTAQPTLSFQAHFGIGLDFEHWDDTRIAPGADWRAEIDQSLNDAAVAILLVSADFLDSDFVVDEELPLLLEAVNDRGLVVIPVLIGPVYLPESSPLARLQTANDGNVPLMNMNEGDQEALFVRVVEAVESALKP